VLCANLAWRRSFLNRLVWCSAEQRRAAQSSECLGGKLRSSRTWRRSLLNRFVWCSAEQRKLRRQAALVVKPSLHVLLRRQSLSLGCCVDEPSAPLHAASMHRTLSPFAEAEPALLLVFCTNLHGAEAFSAHSSAQQRTAAHSSAQQRTAAHSSANNTYVTDNTYVGDFHDILAQPPPKGGLVLCAGRFAQE